MTVAAPPSNSVQPAAGHSIPVVVLGTDAVVAVHPATPVQLAHACLKAGFASVIPASWGDELIAVAALRESAQRGAGPIIQCSCPVIAHRLLTVGGDLRPMMVSFVPPPVAVARYLRAVYAPVRPRITYVGNCAGAVDESIDVRMSPQALLELLAERQLSIDDQPRVFESIIPADRRRFRSQPGGVPVAEALWSDAGHRTLVEVTADDLSAELAQHLLSGANVLIDVGPRLGCVCTGASPELSHDEVRSRVASLEPPRAPSPVVDESIPLDLRQPVPAAPRTPIDVAARPPISVLSTLGDEAETPPGGLPRLPLSRAGSGETRQRFSPANNRAAITVAPLARDVGRVLPRAFVARRRSSPNRGLPVVRDEDVGGPASPHEEATPQPAALASSPAGTTPAAGAAAEPIRFAGSFTGRQIILIVIVAGIITAIASATVGVLVGRAIVARTPAVTGTR